MEDGLEIEFAPDGRVRCIYKDGIVPLLASALGSELDIARASDVEWEKDQGRTGWAVRAHHDPNLALRINPSGEIVVSKDLGLQLALFEVREDALKSEVKNIWELLP